MNEDQVVVHEAEEGGYWAEAPAIPGCATQGDTLAELMKNVHEAVEGCLSVEAGSHGTGFVPWAFAGPQSNEPTA